VISGRTHKVTAIIRVGCGDFNQNTVSVISG
jgi:hypothetical protein